MFPDASNSTATIPLPFKAGVSASVSQGYGPGFSHVGALHYSVDFTLNVGTEVRSVAPGMVVDWRGDIPEGSSASVIAQPYSVIASERDSVGPGGFGNFITILHTPEIGDPFFATYAHLAPGTLPEGIFDGYPVGVGDDLGDVGNTGLRTATHLHFQIGTEPITSSNGDGYPTGSETGSDSNVNTTVLAGNGLGFGSTGTPSSGPPALFAAEDSGILVKGNFYTSQPISTSSPITFPEEGVSETISFADAADGFGVSNGSDVAELYLESIFGTAISNVTYTGSENAAFLVSDFEIPGVDIDFEGGILLSSGDFPGPLNTDSGFTVEHGTAGDSDLLDVVQAAFPTAGATQDASVLTFDIFIEDPDVDGIRFDIVFGSEEYSEFSNSDYVDVAAVWIDDNRNGIFEVGENKALFDGNRNTPLSVINENLALNFVDNEGVVGEFGNIEGAPYAIEWDGFGALAVRPSLQQGWNSIKIAVADTGDQALDSAIYVTNFELLTGGATGDDVFTVLNGLVGQNDLEANGTKQEINLAGGLGTVSGTLMELNGDIITGFDAFKALIFDQINFIREQLSVFSGSAILEVDSDRDGTADSTVTLEGDFSSGDFMAVRDGSNTVVTFETFLADLKEGQAIDPDLVNGIINQDFLKGDGSTDFKVTLQDMGFAGYDNVVGVYEIDASGNIVDTRILFENANSDKVAEAGITDVEAGNKLGFFIVQDAAVWATTLAAGDTLSFVNNSGTAATIADGSDISIAVNGAAVDEMVFHSFAEDMNSDGVQHALSGVDVGGESISVGFEDLTGGGDRDYEDVVFHVELVDNFIFV